jgi:glycosyltransferase involved in cell wall biosynthesis
VRLRVALDGTSLLGTRTGVGHVTAGLLGALAPRPDLELVVFAVTWRGRHALAATVPAGVAAAVAPIPARLARTMWRHSELIRAERWTGRVDVLHATNFVAPPSRAPTLITLHDLTFARYPELCAGDVPTYPQLIRRALDRGATVHVVSDFVGDEVRAQFGLEPHRVVRVYPGLRSASRGDGAAGRQRAGADRYLLTLGTVEPRKNLPTLVRAFDRIAGAHPGLVLVVAGPDGWDQEALATATAAARHGGRVHRLGYVSERDRCDLLAGAAVFAYPSRYEGFGHPPLEAMTAGVPVVAGRAGALPEVLDDAALLVAPDDEAGLADALDRVLRDGTLADALVVRGRERAGRFSWDRMADELAALYRSLARELG